MPDGMPLDTTPTAPPQSPAAPAPQPTTPPPAPAYTQEQVDALVRQAHDSGAAAARRAAEGRTRQETPPPAPKPDPAPAHNAAPEQIAAIVAREVAKESAFGDALREHGLNPIQAGLLRQLRPHADLPDAAAVHEWVKEKAAAFGRPATTTAPAPAPTANVPAPLSPAAPAAGVPLERDVSIADMSAEQIRERMAKQGANMARPYQLANGRAARRDLRVAFEQAVQSRRFRVG